jgi:DNA polymerase I
MIAFDTEFYADGGRVPPLVCLSWASPTDEGILDAKDGRAWFREHLGRDTLVGHTTATDVAVLCRTEPDLIPRVWAAYRKGLLKDIYIRARLIDLATVGGIDRIRYSLAALVKRHLGRILEKENTWRLRYKELDGIPLDSWPIEAKEYALADARATLQIYRVQGDRVVNEREQTLAAWCLHLIGVWGMRTDGAAIEELETELQDEIAALGSLLGPVLRANGTINKKELQLLIEKGYELRGIPVPLTPPTDSFPDGQVKISAEAIQPIADHEVMGPYVTRQGLMKTLDFVTKIKPGINGALQSRYRTLKETGRTSCTDPNIQQIPRRGGVRECFVPRSGLVYIDADYDSIELRCWAEICLAQFGHSTLAEWYQTDPDFDPHTYLAAAIVGIPYKEALRLDLKDERQMCKVANYGYLGGMGPPTFRAYARNFGVEISDEKSRELKAGFLRTWPEAKEYLSWIGSLVEFTGATTIEHLYSGRVRAGCSYCQAANTLFQGLAADGAKAAMDLIMQEQYCDEGSPLFGTRTVAFIHDEFIIESISSDEVKERLVTLMIQGMETLVKRVPIRASAKVLNRWTK